MELDQKKVMDNETIRQFLVRADDSTCEVDKLLDEFSNLMYQADNFGFHLKNLRIRLKRIYEDLEKYWKKPNKEE